MPHVFKDCKEKIIEQILGLILHSFMSLSKVINSNPIR